MSLFFGLSVGDGFVDLLAIFSRKRIKQQIKRPIESQRGKKSGPMGTFSNCLNVKVTIKVYAENAIPMTDAAMFAFFKISSFFTGYGR